MIVAQCWSHCDWQIIVECLTLLLLYYNGFFSVVSECEAYNQDLNRQRWIAGKKGVCQVIAVSCTVTNATVVKILQNQHRLARFNFDDDVTKCLGDESKDILFCLTSISHSASRSPCKTNFTILIISTNGIDSFRNVTIGGDRATPIPVLVQCEWLLEISYYILSCYLVNVII